MSTKTTTAAIAVAGVLALGAIGGTAYALNQPEPAETPAAVSTETPAPENTVEPTPSVEPTPEATEPHATDAPVTAAPPSADGRPLEGEDAYLYYAGEMVRGFGYEITDADLLAAGAFACEQLDAGAGPFEIKPIDGITEQMNAGVVSVAQDYLCG